MPKKTNTSDEDIVQDPVSPEVSEDSPQKAEFRAFIEKYAKQNPEKYALKKEALEAKLNTL
jgi:hypothetical protein